MPPIKKKPIYVPDPNDPRIRAYKDSLNDFTFNKRELNKIIKTGKTPLGSPVDVSKKRYLTRDQDINEAYNRYKKLGLNITKKDVIDESDSFDFKHGKKINKKIAAYNIPIIGGGLIRLAQYKEPEQPYIYKKVKKKKEKKEDIIPTPVKESIPKDTIPVIKPVIEPQLEKEPKPIVPKKLPGGSGPFARYSNMKSKLGSMKTSRMVNAKKVQNIVPTFAEGTKNIKKYQFGEDNLNLPIKYVNRNDPRIKASADSIYAYNTTRGNSPNNIVPNINEIKNFNDMSSGIDNYIKSDPNLKPEGKQRLLSEKEDLNKRIQEINQTNFRDQPVKPGAFGSKVIVKKNKKSLGYFTIRDPEIERIKKKNKPIHYLSEQRYADEPVNSTNNYTHIKHSNDPISGTKRFPVQKPLTKNVETNSNIDLARKVYPNITQEEINKIEKRIKSDAQKASQDFINPKGWYDPSKESYEDYGFRSPKGPDVYNNDDFYNNQYKKNGIIPEDISYFYQPNQMEIPQFAKPKYKWLPKDEEEKKKKEEKKKEEITPKKPEETPIKIPTETQIVPKEEPIISKKLPGGTGAFARYPKKQGFFNKLKNSFSGLMQNRKVNSRNVNNITVTGPKFISGAKSVKQYRGDENLPEAKKGMKNCGCKHSKSKYKYQDGSKDVTLNQDYIDYLNLIKNRLSKNSKSNNYDLILNDYKKDFKNPNKYKFIVDNEPVSETEEPEEKITVRKRNSTETPKQPKRSGVHNTPTKNKFFRFKFKEGTGALTIPEGSAIVTANGGKNKQALMAYKKGNYKLLNKIIDDMPEDNVDKAQVGKKATKIKGKSVTDPTTKETFQEQSVLGDARYGSELPQNEAEEIYKMSEADLKRKHKGITVAQELARRQAVANKQDNFTFNYGGKEYKGYKDAGYSSGYKEQDMTFPGGAGNGSSTSSSNSNTTKEDEYEDVDTETIKAERPVMSTGETSAIGKVLSQGVPKGPRESYLKLGRYNYASQLPKTLQENALAEQAGRNVARDIVAGDAGRYLAQSGNLSGSRMKLNNEAVIQDTLARQDILNKNVDLFNTEATTNRNLKDSYDDIKRQNVNDYNALLVKGGQSFDESFDNYQKMKNENQLKAQELQLLKEASPNYTMIQDPNDPKKYKSVYRYKKVNKTSGASATTGTAPANTTSTGTQTNSGKMTMNGAQAPVTPSVNSNAVPSTTSSTNTLTSQLQNYASGITNRFNNSGLSKAGNYAGQMQENVMPSDDKFTNFQSRIGRFTKKTGTKKLKTYKRK